MRYYSVSSTSQFTITAKFAEFEITNIYPKLASPQKPHSTFKITGSLFLFDLSMKFDPKKNQSFEIAPWHTYISSSILLCITAEMFHFKSEDVLTVQIIDDISGKITEYQDAITILQNQTGIPKC